MDTQFSGVREFTMERLEEGAMNNLRMAGQMLREMKPATHLIVNGFSENEMRYELLSDSIK